MNGQNNIFRKQWCQESEVGKNKVITRKRRDGRRKQKKPGYLVIVRHHSPMLPPIIAITHQLDVLIIIWIQLVLL